MRWWGKRRRRPPPLDDSGEGIEVILSNENLLSHRLDKDDDWIVLQRTMSSCSTDVSSIEMLSVALPSPVPPTYHTNLHEDRLWAGDDSRAPFDEVADAPKVPVVPDCLPEVTESDDESTDRTAEDPTTHSCVDTSTMPQMRLTLDGSDAYLAALLRSQGGVDDTSRNDESVHDMSVDEEEAVKVCLEEDSMDDDAIRPRRLTFDEEETATPPSTIDQVESIPESTHAVVSLGLVSFKTPDQVWDKAWAMVRPGGMLYVTDLVGLLDERPDWRAQLMILPPRQGYPCYMGIKKCAK